MRFCCEVLGTVESPRSCTMQWSIYRLWKTLFVRNVLLVPAQGNQGQASRSGWLYLYMYSNEGKWKWPCRHNESSECSPNSIHSGVHNFKNTWDFHHNIILQMRPNRLYTLGCLGCFLSLHFFLSLKFAKIVSPVNLEHPILMAIHIIQGITHSSSCCSLSDWKWRFLNYQW